MHSILDGPCNPNSPTHIQDSIYKTNTHIHYIHSFLGEIVCVAKPQRTKSFRGEQNRISQTRMKTQEVNDKFSDHHIMNSVT